MSRHPARAYPGYTPWQSLEQSADSSVDATTSSFAPPIVQNVWLIECKHCRTFLTNRGMKAVLLLRPQVALYSTDALPVNCSAYSARPPSTDSPHQQPNRQQHRTCECLTQTLCCHGCGTSVGYTVVVPCTLCISSGANRGTNGHRFVFHSSEIIVAERHYAPGEPGILPAYTGRSSSSPSLPNPAWSPPSFLPSTPDPAEVHPSSTASPALTSSYNAMPPPAPESPCPVSSSTFPDPQKPSPQPLRAGDLLYWHHLKQGGEIPGATYDPRARGISPIVFDR
ncbi:FAM72 protein-domain-containing protein [Russula vinacea]|nr:FAM72 protein-domain-containing protein [Russula vinacea]